jgi:hypothetical protein
MSTGTQDPIPAKDHTPIDQVNHFKNGCVDLNMRRKQPVPIVFCCRSASRPVGRPWHHPLAPRVRWSR